ncbi:hypothetical protein AVEN_134757-1 [Araneus ventricosus]|uniref:Uncharacterized protein n=1 Tax=Araneus ventricosus TaxID=182803 RepID=A0A4Y2S161_ARAVE|nr:hypothetical protein AVEN_57632-1 [Araneus ventricosus]GBN80995.1 hypothetical protein AVEN_134757-1 [Araneus ventricosus]
MASVVTFVAVRQRTVRFEMACAVTFVAVRQRTVRFEMFGKMRINDRCVKPGSSTVEPDVETTDSGSSESEET